MRYLITRTAAVLIAVAALVTPAQTVWALGTAAGISIDNRATVDYTVSTVPQTAIDSSPLGNSTPGAGADTSFLVDDRIDLTLTNQDAANISVVPGQTGAVTEYLLTNTGNATHDFRLTGTNGGVVPYPPPAADTFDVNLPISVFVENGLLGGYQSSGVNQDTGTHVDELVAGGTATIYVVADMPAPLVNNDLAVVTLRATAATAGPPAGAGLGLDSAETVGADTPGAVDIVFGDPDSDGDTFPDGYEEAQGGYVVQTAALTITKTSRVVMDPFNGTTNPKAIPGATIEYTVRIDNAGPATATSVTVTDDLSTEIGAGTVAFDTTAYSGVSGVRLDINGAGFVNLTNANDGDQGEWDDTSANTVIVNTITLTTGQFAEVQYRVIVTYP